MNSSSPLHSVPVRLIRKDDRAKVSQLLLMLHLLFTKYVFTSVRVSASAFESYSYMYYVHAFYFRAKVQPLSLLKES